MKSILVLGAGGFIGGHLVNQLKAEGHRVTGVDIKQPEFCSSSADSFIVADLREQAVVRDLFTESFDEVYQLAADMGGAGFVFVGKHDADILHNSMAINLNIVEQLIKHPTTRLFFSSSACIYPEHNQTDPNNPNCAEHTAYPANPDSEYGWEKLFSERLYLAAAKNYGVTVRIARYHNIFGPYGTWQGGREKAPAALSRKVAEAADGTSIEIWGDGNQTRSFLYIDECIRGTLALMASNCTTPVNIGSEELVSINQLAKMIIQISGKALDITHITGPLGVRGRNSDNTLMRQLAGWDNRLPLHYGLEKTYHWVNDQVNGT